MLRDFSPQIKAETFYFGAFDKDICFLIYVEMYTLKKNIIINSSSVGAIDFLSLTTHHNHF